MLTPKTKSILKNQSYSLVGNHSACKICTWTKKSLLDKDVCYKQTFYNIKSHLCCQMSPCISCSNSCVYCWRHISKDTLALKFKEKPDDPKLIIDECIKSQRILLSGFGGNKLLNKNKFKEAQDPKYFAISLIGEPTLYPLLGDLIDNLHKRKFCSFLVTNGQFPEKLASLKRLPTQLYVSLDGPTEKIYKQLDKPLLKTSWQKLNKTLELLPSLKTRKVIRLTLIKGMNMENIEDYAKLIKKANPDFIECKAYMFVGGSRQRLSIQNMPYHEDIIEFSKKLSEATGLKIIDEKKESRVTLLAEKDSKKRKLKF